MKDTVKQESKNPRYVSQATLNDGTNAPNLAEFWKSQHRDEDFLESTMKNASAAENEHLFSSRYHSRLPLTTSSIPSIYFSPQRCHTTRKVWRDEAAVIGHWSPRPSQVTEKDNVVDEVTSGTMSLTSLASSPQFCSPTNTNCSSLNSCKSKSARTYRNENQVGCLGIATPMHYRPGTLNSSLPILEEDREVVNF